MKHNVLANTLVIQPNKLCQATQAGFTLIETLIAVAIVAIALSALLFTTSESIHAQSQIENSMVANWIGQNTLIAQQYELNDYLSEHQSTNQLNKNWTIQYNVKEDAHRVQMYLIDISLQGSSHFRKRITGYHYHDPLSS